MAPEIENTRDLISSIEPTSILPAGKDKTAGRDMLSAFFSSRERTVAIGDRIPPWWSPERDKWLWRLMLGSDVLGGAIFSTSARLTSIPVHVYPNEPDNRNQRRIVSWSDMLLRHYWSEISMQVAIDWQTQDNGAFIEILGAGDPGGPIEPTKVPGTNDYIYATGLRVLDSQRATRTKDSTYPVVYRHTLVDGSEKIYKFHNTRVIYTAQMPTPRAEMLGVGFCLAGDSVVRMADGRAMRILDVVESRDPGPVLSMADDGTMVERRITAWHTNPRGDRRMVNLRGELARSCKGVKETNTWLTEDHLVLTPGGYVPAGQLRTGDAIVTALPAPSHMQMELLVGTLLGDASLNVRGQKRNPDLSFGHCEAQEEWLQIKAQALGAFGGTISRSDMKLRYKGNTTLHGFVRFQGHAQPGFRDLRSAFYPDGKKRIPLHLLEKYISPRLLAAWYMDDGNIMSPDGPFYTGDKRGVRGEGKRSRAVITTDGYTCADVEEAARILTSAGYLCRTTSTKAGKSCSLIFSTEGAAALFSAIAPLVPPSMRYKIPSALVDAPYDAALWDLGEPERLVDRAIITEDAQNWRNRAKQVYCISVDETENFVTANMVVHNCGVSRVVHNILRLDDIMLLEDEIMGSRPASQLVFGRGVDADELVDAFEKSDEKAAALNNDRRRTARTVFFTVDGSPELVRAAGIEMFDLKKLPQGYDPDITMNLAINVMAMGLGFDSREFWPATVRGATRADAEVQHWKSMKKTPGIWVETFKRALGTKFAPSVGYVDFDQQDDEQDAAVAAIRQVRAETAALRLQSGQWDHETVWQEQLQNGEITEGQYDALHKSEEMQLQLEKLRLEVDQLASTVKLTDQQTEVAARPTPEPMVAQPAASDEAGK